MGEKKRKRNIAANTSSPIWIPSTAMRKAVKEHNIAVGESTSKAGDMHSLAQQMNQGEVPCLYAAGDMQHKINHRAAQVLLIQEWWKNTRQNFESQLIKINGTTHFYMPHIYSRRAESSLCLNINPHLSMEENIAFLINEISDSITTIFEHASNSNEANKYILSETSAAIKNAMVMFEILYTTIIGNRQYRNPENTGISGLLSQGLDFLKPLATIGRESAILFDTFVTVPKKSPFTVTSGELYFNQQYLHLITEIRSAIESFMSEIPSGMLQESHSIPIDEFTNSTIAIRAIMASKDQKLQQRIINISKKYGHHIEQEYQTMIAEAISIKGDRSFAVRTTCPGISVIPELHSEIMEVIQSLHRFMWDQGMR